MHTSQDLEQQVAETIANCCVQFTRHQAAEGEITPEQIEAIIRAVLEVAQLIAQWTQTPIDDRVVETLLALTDSGAIKRLVALIMDLL